MKVIITGRPNEIAALAVETQRRQLELGMDLRISKQQEDLNAFVRSVTFLKSKKPEWLDPGLPVSEE